MMIEDLRAVTELVGEIWQIKLERDIARIERDQAKQTVEMQREQIIYLRRRLLREKPEILPFPMVPTP